MLPEAPTPEYRRGYLDAGSQILAALDESVIAANNALPIGVDPLVAEDLVRMVAHGHPGWDLNPLPLAVGDMAKTLVKIRETLQLERAADSITDAVTRSVSPVEGTDDVATLRRCSVHGWIEEDSRTECAPEHRNDAAPYGDYRFCPVVLAGGEACDVQLGEPVAFVPRPAPVVGSDDVAKVLDELSLHDDTGDEHDRGYMAAINDVRERLTHSVGSDDEPTAWLLVWGGHAAEPQSRLLTESLSEVRAYQAGNAPDSVQELVPRSSRPAPVGQTVTGAMLDAVLPAAGERRDELVQLIHGWLVRAEGCTYAHDADTHYDALRAELAATAPEPVPSEVLALERLHEWITAAPRRSALILSSPTSSISTDVRVVLSVAGDWLSSDDDAMVANAILCALQLAPASPEPKGGAPR